MFKKLDKAKKHTHVAVINPDGMSGVSSPGPDGHIHDIVMGMDMMTGEQAGLNVLPVENHTHTLSDIPLGTENPEVEKDEDKAEDAIRLRKEAEKFEEESFKKAVESEGFYDGTDHWTKAARRSLKNAKRACITANYVQPLVDTLTGYLSRNRHDYKFFPNEGGDQFSADIMTETVKLICTNNDFEFAEVRVFKDEAVTGRGNFNIYMDFDRNRNGDGELIIEHYPWRDVRFGPHVYPDLRDCEYMSKSKMYSLAEAKNLWPDKKKELSDCISQDNGDGTISEVNRNPVDQYREEGEPITSASSSDEMDIARKLIRITEIWRKEPITVPVLVYSNPNGEVEAFNAEDWSKSDLDAATSIPGTKLVRRKIYRMRVTMVAGGKVLLSDEYPDLPEVNGVPEFEVVPAYAKKQGDKFWGVVEAVKDLSREINFRFSQAADILKNMMAKGWFYDNQTFESPQEETKFKENANSPGWMSKLQDVNHKPEQPEPVPFPTELTNYALLMTDQLHKVGNINPDLMGAQTNSRTGNAIAERKDAGLIGNEFLYDNHAFAKRKLAKMIIAYIQKYYTADRLYRMLANRNAQMSKSMQIGGQDLSEITPQKLQEVLDNLDLTLYDITVGESAYSPTARQANLKQWTDIQAQGGNVPMEMLIDMSDLPDKDKYLKMLDDQRNMQMQEVNAKNQTEIAKTQIAANAKQTEAATAAP